MLRATWRSIETGSSPTVGEGSVSPHPSPPLRLGYCPTTGDAFGQGKNSIDEFAVCFYYHLNTGKEVIKKYMSSNHSEVAET